MDLTDLHHDQLAEAISQQYHDFVVSRWRAATLGDREEDYVDLAVPFAQKDQAKAAGAKWDPGRRVWRVNLAQVDPDLFHAWLPADRQAS